VNQSLAISNLAVWSQINYERWQFQIMSVGYNFEFRFELHNRWLWEATMNSNLNSDLNVQSLALRSNSENFKFGSLKSDYELWQFQIMNRCHIQIMNVGYNLEFSSINIYFFNYISIIRWYWVPWVRHVFLLSQIMLNYDW